MASGIGIYELYGQLYFNANEFLQDIAHEFKHGDRDYAMSKLEDYGFNMSDIGR